MSENTGGPDEGEGIRECLQLRTLLFLNLDIVGSTASKQQGNFPETINPYKEIDQQSLVPLWHTAIMQILHEAEDAFRTELNRRKTEFKKSVKKENLEFAFSNNNPEIWKINGDDITYKVQVCADYEAVFFVFCWKLALQKVRQKAIELGLDVKGAAWLAQFPFLNNEIFVSQLGEGEESISDTAYWNLLDKYFGEDTCKRAKYKVDYIGPSMDLGFRIAARAAPHKLVICHMLMRCVAGVLSEKKFIELFQQHGVSDVSYGLDENVVLKGAYGNQEIDLFWLEVNSHNLPDLEIARRKILGDSVKTDWKSAKDYLEHFYDRYCNYVPETFFDKSCVDSSLTSQDFERKISSYQKRINKVFDNEEEVEKIDFEGYFFNSKYNLVDKMSGKLGKEEIADGGVEDNRSEE